MLSAAENYNSQLDIAGNGIIGYVIIPKIQVNLPIYHGTDAEVLDRGVGHLLGSSLPVGGKNTHTILSGHSGMASQKMFTDLEQLVPGDVFYLNVLGETMAYQVTEINTVLPYETDLLGIVPGEDLCTLVTCTPYGINTHRLLVRGSRIPYEEAAVMEEETAHWRHGYQLRHCGPPGLQRSQLLPLSGQAPRWGYGFRDQSLGNPDLPGQ